MTKELDKIWADIQEQRANYQRIINAATDTINNARKLIADAREGMDSLPVAKTRRSRKASLSEEMGAQSMGYGAGVGAIDDPAWDAIRDRTYCVDDVSAEAVPADEFSGEKLNAKLDALASGKLPSALEMFPYGIERDRKDDQP